MIITEDDVGEVMARMGRTLERLTSAVAAEGLK
jgi:4-aminobutyrate--pyruvate transaminase